MSPKDQIARYWREVVRFRHEESLEFTHNVRRRYRISFDDAEELVSFALTAIVEQSKKNKKPPEEWLEEDLERYLSVIIRNRVIWLVNRRRKLSGILKEKTRTIGCDHDNGQQVGQIVDSEALHRALQLLDPLEREVIQRTFFFDHTLSDIAKDVGKSVPTICRSLKRAIIKLRSLL